MNKYKMEANEFSILISILEILAKTESSVEIVDSKIRCVSNDRYLIINIDLSKAIKSPINLAFIDLKKIIAMLKIISQRNEEVEVSFDENYYYFATPTYKWNKRIPLKNHISNEYIQESEYKQNMDLDNFQFLAKTTLDNKDVEDIGSWSSLYNSYTIEMKFEENDVKLCIGDTDCTVSFEHSIEVPVMPEVLKNTATNIVSTAITMTKSSTEMSMFLNNAAKDRLLVKLTSEIYGVPFEILSKVVVSND